MSLMVLMKAPGLVCILPHTVLFQAIFLRAPDSLGTALSGPVSELSLRLLALLDRDKALLLGEKLSWEHPGVAGAQCCKSNVECLGR